MSASKGLNTSGGQNRLRFEKYSKRLQSLNVDVVHRVRPSSRNLDTENPDTGKLGCFFQDELQQRRALDSSGVFKKFAFTVFPWVQSLPELLHHQDKVVDCLVKNIKTVDNLLLKSYLCLVSVLARDLQEDLYPHFAKLFRALMARIVVDPTDTSTEIKLLGPEEQGQVLECMSYLVKFSIVRLRDDAQVLFEYYGPLLGHHQAHIRQLAANCFVPVVRKLKPAQFQVHTKKLFKALTMNANRSMEKTSPHLDMAICLLLQPPSAIDIRFKPLDTEHATAVAEEDVSRSLPGQRMDNILDGAASLLAFACKGVKGCLHSKGGLKLSKLLEYFPMMPAELSAEVEGLIKQKEATTTAAAASVSESVPSSAVKGKKKGGEANVPVADADAVELPAAATKYLNQFATVELTHASVVGWTMCKVISRLFRHVHPSRALELWLRVVAAAQAMVHSVKAMQFLASTPSIRGVSDEQLVHAWMQFLVHASFFTELLIFSVCFANGRNLADTQVKQTLGKSIVKAISRFIRDILSVDLSGLLSRSALTDVVTVAVQSRLSGLKARAKVLFCELWLQFSTERSLLLGLDELISLVLQRSAPIATLANFPSIRQEDSPINLVSMKLFSKLPEKIIRNYLLRPLICNIATSIEHSADRNWLSGITEILFKLKDVREDFVSSCEASVVEAAASSKRTGRLAINREAGVSVAKEAVAVEEDWEPSSEEDDDDDDDSDDEGAVRKTGQFSISKQVKKRKAIVNFAKLEDVNQDSQELEKWLSVCGDELNIVAAHCANLIQCRLEAILKVQKSKKTTAQLSECSNSELSLAIVCIEWIVVNAPQSFASGDLSSKLTSVLTAVVSLLNLSSEKFVAAISDISTSNLSRSVNLLASIFKVAETNSALASFTHSALVTTQSLGQAIRNIYALITGDVRALSIYSAALALFRLAIRIHVSSGSKGAAALASYFTGDELAAVVDSLGKALQSPSHWIRVLALQVLCVLPFDKVPVKPKSQSTQGDEEEPVNIVATCLEVAMTPTSLATERTYARLLGKLEVLARLGQLSPTLMKIVCSFCMGQLYIKFMPVWEAAVLVIVACASSGAPSVEELVWERLMLSIDQLPESRLLTDEDTKPGDVEGASLQHIVERLSSVEVESGFNRISVREALSTIFHFSGVSKIIDSAAVDPDVRTDSDVVYANVWSVLKRCPSITLQKSKLVVPIFFRFLEQQYYPLFKDDPDIPFLVYCGVLPSTFSVDNVAVSIHTAPVLRRRLELFLSIFAAISNPRQLFNHALLFSFYSVVVCKPETNIVKLAVDCMLTYKPQYLITYQDRIKRILDEKTLREELVLFDAAPGVVIDNIHREALLTILLRIVFGRLLSKPTGNKSKDQKSSRRTALMAFAAPMVSSELRHLVQLMLRSVVPTSKLASLQQRLALNPVADRRDINVDTTRLMAWFDGVDAVVMDLQADDVSEVVWERQIGFLHMLEPLVNSVGHGISPYIGLISQLLVTFLTHAQNVRETLSKSVINAHVPEELGVVDDDEEVAEVHTGLSNQTIINQAIRVRTLCMQVFTLLIQQYHKVISFEETANAFLQPLRPLIEDLSVSITASTKSSSLLSLLHVLTVHTTVIESRQDVVQSVIRCVACRSEPVVMNMVMDIMMALLDRNNAEALIPHSQLIIQSFSKRFVGPGYDVSTVAPMKLSDMHITPSGSVKHELALLCRISEEIFSRKDVVVDSISVSSLSILLLGMVRTYTTTKKVRVDETWAIDILRIYRCLLWRVDNVQTHVPFISKLFGPAAHSLSLFNFESVRSALVQVFVALSEHPSTENVMTQSVLGLKSLTARDVGLLDSRDFDRCMPVFQGLASPVGTAGDHVISWPALLGPESCPTPKAASMCTVVLYECFRCMYDNELAVRNAALLALKSFVNHVCSWCKDGELAIDTAKETITATPGKKQTKAAQAAAAAAAAEKSAQWIELICGWWDLLTSIYLPSLHNGFTHVKDSQLKGFVLLLSHTIRTVGFYAAESSLVLGSSELLQQNTKLAAMRKQLQSFHIEMSSLLHEDPEQDFFENIVHMQLHRRVRTLNRLRMSLVANAASTETSKKAVADVVSPTVVSHADDETEVVVSDDEGDKRSTAGDDEDAAEMVTDPSDGPVQLFSAVMFSPSSFTKILTPIALHALSSDEFTKKDHLTLLQESAAFLGAVAMHLPWSTYLRLIKTLLRLLSQNKVEKEKVLLTSLCAVLEAFHFDLSGSSEATGIEEVVVGVSDYRDSTLFKPTRPAKRVIAKVVEGITEQTEEEAVDEDADEEGVEGDAEEEKAVAVVKDEQKMEEEPEEEEETTAEKSHVMARTIMNTLLPWIGQYLLKEEKDHNGNNSKTVRSAVAVALAKLLSRLQAPLVSEHKKISHFMSLVIKVIGTLKSRDTNSRDAARESLARMVMTMGMHTLKLVVYEMRHMLTEGFQKHVCNYSIRNMLTTILKHYTPPLDAYTVPVFELVNSDSTDLLESIQIVVPEFDQCIPMLMAGVMDDLVGDTRDDLNATKQGVARHVIRESKGSKANDVLEICAKHLLFRPGYALKGAEDPASVSSIHAISIPLLQALQSCESSETIGRISEGLHRLSLGLARNPSVQAPELLLYLHSTLHPFVVKIVQDLHEHEVALGKLGKSSSGKSTKQASVDDVDLDDAMLGDDLPSYLRDESSDEDEKALYSKKRVKEGDDVTKRRASTWLPSERSSITEQRKVIEERNREREERTKVIDGVNAPKLTGRDKKRPRGGKEHGVGGAVAGAGSNPAVIASVRFCLSVLQGCLKNGTFNSSDEQVRSMVVPFLPLLAQCLRLTNASNIVSTAMRCLCSILVWGIPVEPVFGRAVGTRMLKLMFAGGALLSTDSDLVQACMKGMTSLFQLHFNKTEKKTDGSTSATVEGARSAVAVNYSVKSKTVLPLDDANIRSLIQLLTVSIMEVTSTYQNTAFNLIRSLVDHRVLFPEMYDLVEKLTQQIVLSHRKGVRDSASGVLVSFMVGYPLGEKRFNSHMNQLLGNCQFEYEEGRESALSCLSNLIRLLPAAVLEDSALMIFLPMTLRLVNDKSAKCREAAASVVTILGRKVSAELFATFFEYATKWLCIRATQPVSSNYAENSNNHNQTKALERTGAQVLAILTAARPDLVKKSDNVANIVEGIRQVLIAVVSRGGEFSAFNKVMAVSATSGGAPTSSAAVRKRVPALWKRDSANAVEGIGEIGIYEDWTVLYYMLVLLEELFNHLPGSADYAVTHPVSSVEDSFAAECLVMDVVQEALLFPHVWVRSVSARVLRAYLSRRDVFYARLSTSPSGKECLLVPNSMYHLGRRLCVVLNQPVMVAKLLEAVIPSMVFVIRALAKNPQLSVEEISDEIEEEEEEEVEEEVGASEDVTGEEDEDEEEVDGDGDDQESDIDDAAEDEEEVPASAVSAAVTKTGAATAASGANWMMQRLRAIGADTRGKRRHNVIKVFMALVAVESTEFVTTYLSLIIEVAMRARMMESGPDADAVKEGREMGSELLDSLEKKVGAVAFVGCYAVVQKQLVGRKTTKKRILAAQALTNPKAYAQRKLDKTLQKRNAQKRKNHKYESLKGAKRPRGPTR